MRGENIRTDQSDMLARAADSREFISSTRASATMVSMTWGSMPLERGVSLKWSRVEDGNGGTGKAQFHERGRLRLTAGWPGCKRAWAGTSSRRSADADAVSWVERDSAPGKRGRSGRLVPAAYISISGC